MAGTRFGLARCVAHAIYAVARGESILGQKLDVKDRTQAAIYAMTHGLVSSPV